MRLLALTFFFFFCISAFTQEDPILKKMGAYRSEFSLRDSSLVTRLNRMAGDSSFLNPERSQVFSRRALTIAKKIEFDEGQCSSLLVIATAKVYSNQFDSAIYYTKKSRALADRIKSTKWRVKSLEMIGNIHSYKEEYTEAIKYLLEAARIADQEKKELLPPIYCNIGYVFDKTDNAEKAEEYCNKALVTGYQYKDTGALMTAYNILGLLTKVKDSDRALAYFEKGLDLAQQKGHPKRESELLYNMSNIYFSKGDDEKAFELFNKSIEVAKHKGSYLSIAIGYQAMGENYNKINEDKLALQYSDSAMKYSLLCGNYEVIMETSYLISELYAKQKDYKKALEYLSKAYDYKDSLNLAEVNSAVTDAEAKYESEKKELQFKLDQEREKELSEAKIKSRELLLWLAGLALVLFVIAAIILNKQNKRIKNRNELVELQKTEIEQQHLEITESIRYAERIQNTLLPHGNEWGLLRDRHTIYFNPRNVVSGDFYWVYNDLTAEVSYFAVADCTGHGVPGALVSMLAISALAEIMNKSRDRSTGEILDLLRERIISDLTKDDKTVSDGLDIVFCKFDHRSREMEFSGANNNLWIIEPKQDQVYENTCIIGEKNVLKELKGDRMPIGHYFKLNMPFTTHRFSLLEGSQLILSTDGMADQFGGPDNKKYKYAKLKEFFLLHRDRTSERVKSSELDEEFTGWKGDNEQTDDVSLLIVDL